MPPQVISLPKSSNIDPEGETRYIGDFGGAAGARYHFSAFAPYTYDPSTGKPVMCTLSAFSEESRTQSPQHLTLLMYINDREEREYFLILEKEDINGNSLPGVDTAWVVSDPGGDMSYFVQPGHYYFGRSWSITEKQYSALAEAGIQEWLSVYSTKIAPSSTTPVPLTTNFLP